MAAVIDVIKRAYRLLGVYSIGETPTSEEANDAFYALNNMLATWANESLLVVAPTLDAIPLVAGVGAITVGPTGTFVTTPVVEVLRSSFISLNGASTPLLVATLAQYNGIVAKGVSGGVPLVLLRIPGAVNSQITLYPAPVAGCVLNLWSNKAQIAFTDLTQTVVLPPGYEDALTYNLAVALAPESQLQAPSTVDRLARSTKRLLKRTNQVTPVLGLPNVVTRGNYR